MSKIRTNKYYEDIMMINILCIYMLVFTVLVISYQFTDMLSGKTFELLEDKSNNLNIEQVHSDEVSKQFKPIDGAGLHIGISDSAWWVRFKLSENNSDKVLLLTSSNVQEAVLYYRSSDKETFSELHSGWNFNKRDSERCIYTAIRIPDEATTDDYCYLRLRTPFSFASSICCFSEKEFSHFINRDLVSQGILFGMLLTILAFNIILCFSYHYPVNICYSFFLIIIIFFHAYYDGLFRILTDDLQERLNSEAANLYICFAAVALWVLFINTSLNFSKSFPVFNRISNVLLVAFIPGVVLHLMNKLFLTTICIGISLVATSVYSFVFTSYAVKKGIKHAKYMYYGSNIMALGHIIFILGYFGFITNRYISSYTPLLASWISATLFSMALVQQVRESEEDQNRIRKLIKKTNNITRTKLIASKIAQIDTNVLFDAMDTASSLCLSNKEKARELMVDMSDFLRYNFDFNHQGVKIPFEDELEKVETYVKVEKSILRDRFDVVYRLEDTGELFIHSMILQPLISKAIEHSVKNTTQKGEVIIEVKSLDDRYVISVSDNGNGLPEDKINSILYDTEDGEKSRLGQINDYLKVLYGSHLIISSKVNVGTKISFFVPKSKENVKDGLV